MAGGRERVLKRRIKSVESTKKNTRAMELISATRVVKAQERAAAARPYSEQITSVILDLVRAGAAKDHPLLRENPDATKACFLIITSDRGLCGAYNSAVIRLAERQNAVVVLQNSFNWNFRVGHRLLVRLARPECAQRAR